MYINIYLINQSTAGVRECRYDSAQQKLYEMVTTMIYFINRRIEQTIKVFLTLMYVIDKK